MFFLRNDDDMTTLWTREPMDTRRASRLILACDVTSAPSRRFLEQVVPKWTIFQRCSCLKVQAPARQADCLCLMTMSRVWQNSSTRKHDSDLAILHNNMFEIES